MSLPRKWFEISSLSKGSGDSAVFLLSLSEISGQGRGTSWIKGIDLHGKEVAYGNL